MNFNDSYQLGHVAKTFGLAGEIAIILDVSDPSYYSKLDVVFIKENDQLVPHFVKSIRINSNKATVGLEGLSTKDEADLLVGKEVYLPLKYLPKLKKGEYYYHDLIGFDVIQGKTYLGKVDKIYDLGTQNLFSVIIDNHEVMIPFNKEILKEVDIENAKIVVELPDGLIDIYTGS